MNLIWRSTDRFVADVRKDLSRRHAFAHERVGFVGVRAASAHDDGIVLIADQYFPVADKDYVQDKRVGARISQEAIRTALEVALLNKVGVFHVHMHLFPTKRLWFSDVDLKDHDNLIPDFFKVRPEMPHGALVLSPTSLAGRAWTDASNSQSIGEFNTVGSMIQIIRASALGDTPYNA